MRKLLRGNRDQQTGVRRGAFETLTWTLIVQAVSSVWNEPRGQLVNVVLVIGAMGANGRTVLNPRGYQVEKSALAETNQLFRPTATTWVAYLRSK
jgi:hypothetical protein